MEEKIDFYGATSSLRRIITIYLFMQADGECNEQDIANLHKLRRKESDIFNADKESFDKVIKHYSFEKEADNSELVMSEMSDALFFDGARYKKSQEETESYLLKLYEHYSATEWNDTYKVQMLWVMLNHAYTKYPKLTDAQKKIIDFFVERMNISKAVLVSLMDNLYTINLLYKKIEWLKLLDMDEAEKQERINEIEKDIGMLKKNSDITLKESDVIGVIKEKDSDGDEVNNDEDNDEYDEDDDEYDDEDEDDDDDEYDDDEDEDEDDVEDDDEE